MNQKKQNFFQKLFKGYHLSIYQKGSYTKVVDYPVSRFRVLILLIVLAIVVAGATTALFLYTPLKQLVSGYPTDDFRKSIYDNALKVDSLETQIAFRDEYLQKIQTVIKGEVVVDEPDQLETQLINENNEAAVSSDSIIEELLDIDAFKFGIGAESETFDDLSTVNFFTPLNGIVINRFTETPGHFGIDIVGKTNSNVSAILDGTVIFAEWSVQTGYVIQIQHAHNLVSVYKHNSSMLVKQGEQVNAGDVVAIMGDEGELSTGPHLHFEMWQNGKPLNPENFISF